MKPVTFYKNVVHHPEAVSLDEVAELEDRRNFEKDLMV